MYIPQQWQTLRYDEHIQDMQTQCEQQYDRRLHGEEESMERGSLLRQALFGLGSRLVAVREDVHPFRSATRTQP